MPTEYSRGADGRVSSVHIKADKGEDDSGALGVSERMKNTSLGSMAKSSKGFPKRADFDSQESWTAAVGKYRRESEADPIKNGQRSALKRQ